MSETPLFSQAEIVGKSTEEQYPWMKDKKFVCVLDPVEVKELVDRSIAAGMCALDTETSGLDTRVYDGKCNTFIAGLCISYDGVSGYYIPVNHGDVDAGTGVWIRNPKICVDLELIRSEIQRLLDNCICIYHNSLYDHAVLEGNGFVIPEFAKPEQKIPVRVGKHTLTVRRLAWEDTHCLAYLWDSSMKRKSLKILSETKLGMKMLELSDLFKGKEIMYYCLDPVNNRDCLLYGASDAICTYLLYQFFVKERVKEDQAFIYYYELRCAISTRQMGKNHCRIDIDKIKEYKSLLLDIQNDVAKEANEMLGREVNLASPAQVALALVNDFKIDVTVKDESTGEVKKVKGKPVYETGVEILEKFSKDCPFIDLILIYRDINKTVGTYLDNFLERADKNNEVRFKFQQWLVETGRFSCSGGEAYEGYSGVNIQALTKPLKSKDKKNPETGELYPFEELVRKKGSGFFLRSAVIARPGCKIVAIDYSGQELRVAANISNEPIWIKEFLEGDGDLHSQTAKIIFRTDTPDATQRDNSKMINFQTLYGGGPKALSESLGISMDAAKDFQQKMLGGLKHLKIWFEKTKKRAHETKYAETPLGRRRKLFGIDSEDRMEVSKAERNAINTPVQGTGGDMMKIAMAQCRDYISKIPSADEVRMLFTVHDELVFEIKEDKLDEHIPNLMNIMSLETILNKALEWKVPLTMDCEVGDSWEVEYEYFKKNTNALTKLNPTLLTAKCRAMNFDPKTLAPLPKEAVAQQVVRKEIPIPEKQQVVTNIPFAPPPAPKVEKEVVAKEAKVEVSFGSAQKSTIDLSPEELKIINSENFNPVAVDKAIVAFNAASDGKATEVVEKCGVDIQKAFYVALSVYVSTDKKQIIPSLEGYASGRELMLASKRYPDSYRDYFYQLKAKHYDDLKIKQLDFLLDYCGGGITRYKILSAGGEIVREGETLYPIMFEVLANYHNL